MRKAILPALIIAALISFPANAATDTYIADEYQGYCYEIGEQYEISPYILMAMIETESSGKQYAKSGGCKGLMQIGTRWHGARMKRLGVSDIYDPRGNILVGADYLSELCSENDGNISLSLDLYNGNSKAYSNARNGITSKYVNKVLTRAAEITEAKEEIAHADEIYEEPEAGR